MIFCKITDKHSISPGMQYTFTFLHMVYHKVTCLPQSAFSFSESVANEFSKKAKKIVMRITVMFILCMIITQLQRQLICIHVKTYSQGRFTAQCAIAFRYHVSWEIHL